jgi:hypothetical protein
MATADCQEQQAFVDGDAAAVRRALPHSYTAVTDPGTGAPVVFVRGLKCASVTVGGRTRPAVTMASFGVTIDSRDGTGCASAAPGGVGSVKGDAPPACNWYTLGWLTTSRAVRRWLLRGAPGYPVVYAPRLRFHLGEFDPSQRGAPFRLVVPASTGTPFVMDASTRPRPGALSVRGGYWRHGHAGTTKLVFATDNLTSGDASGAVMAPAHTPVAKLLGATKRGYLPVFSAIGAEHWDSAVYRLQLMRKRPRQTAFAGSCSLQGTVHFSPGASVRNQPLRYDYPATGTCTGTLNRRHLDGAAVRWHSWGRSHGSCAAAATTIPGRARLTLPGGRSVHLTVDFTSSGTEIDFGFYGARSGMATGHGTFLTQRSDAGPVTGCVGSGATRVPMDVTLTTQTTLTSA